MSDAGADANRAWGSRLSFAALTIGLLAVQSESAGRYVVARDPTSRYGFQYVRDQKTGRWVQREFEIRAVIPAPPPAHPVELRWRLVFADIPGRIP
jgi:hypothetical protein